MTGSLTLMLAIVTVSWLNDNWVRWVVAITLISIGVILYVVPRNLPKPIPLTDTQHQLKEVLGPESSAYRVVPEWDDHTCESLLYVLADEREGDNSRLLLEGVASTADHESMDIALDTLKMRERRIRRFKAAMEPVPLEMDWSTTDQAIAEAQRRTELDNETLGYRDFATWSRKLAVKSAKDVGDEASKSAYLDAYIRALSDVRAGRS